MKYIIIFLFTITVYNSDFCDGWEKGYVRGYCYQDPNCIEPIVPLCPLPNLLEDTYQDGYDRGFLKGKEDKL